MLKSHHHLTYEERCQIFALNKRGDSQADIAKALGVNQSTISRELQRNRGKRGYRYEQAQKKSKARRAATSNNKKMTLQMIAIIEEKLRLQWSPEQIAGWLKKEDKEHVSHETIYRHIWADKKRGGTLYKELRHHGKKYNKRSSKTAGRGCIPDRIDIEERPSIVEEKKRLGDWELDTIIGTCTSGAIVSMVDRVSKLSKLKKVENKTCEKVNDALTGKLKGQGLIVYTLTADNGKEFAGHKYVSAELGAKFFFAKPYHSWERGLNEHTNGLVRQYFPKKCNFKDLSEEDIERVEHLLNNRPRKVLGFETPLQAYQRLASEAEDL